MGVCVACSTTDEFGMLAKAYRKPTSSGDQTNRSTTAAQEECQANFVQLTAHSTAYQLTNHDYIQQEARMLTVV